MPEYCTCGAQLPPDARFCHKCGKPQYETPPGGYEEEDEPAVAPPPPPPPPPPFHEINFRNRMAVRVGLLNAAVAALLISFHMPMAIGLVWMLVCLVGAGFFSVFLYNRRAGTELSARRGARLGWFTGLFCFVIVSLVSTVSILIVTAKSGLGNFYREQLETQGVDVSMPEISQVLDSPYGPAMILLFSLVVAFFFLTLLPALGGLMGAKVLEKD